MKLSKENIQFIDTYLENSGVIYIDIRYEMIDHIATGVEELMVEKSLDFYDAFKNYMVVHKKAILKNNKHRWSYSWQSVKQFLLFLAKPPMLVFGILLFLFFKNLNVNIYFGEDFTVNNLFFVLLLSIIMIQAIYIEFFLKKKFYSIESIAIQLNIIYFFKIIFIPIFGTKEVSPYTLTIFTFLLLGYIIYFIDQIVKFKKHQFNFL